MYDKVAAHDDKNLYLCVSFESRLGSEVRTASVRSLPPSWVLLSDRKANETHRCPTDSPKK
jgi:hypothetical protein